MQKNAKKNMISRVKDIFWGVFRPGNNECNSQFCEYHNNI